MNRIRTIATLLLVPAAVVFGGCGEKSEPPTTGPVVTQSTMPTGLTTTGQTTGATTGPTTTTEPVQSDRLQIIRAATDFLTLPGSTACDKSITPKLLRKAYGDRSGCAAARKRQALAQTYSIGPVQITGSSATLQASVKGGDYGSGEKLKLMLVRDSQGAWRVDTVSSNARVGP